ncbi:MAG: LysR family transcriptional regulator [Actinobacteria bacterium]|nr:LysR family transcriptional regulator [Actinomycetota bacterium]
MHLTHIVRTDLNLIPALAALLEERHVSNAAARIGLSQPAMSRALQRLRSALGDPLLIREPDGYRLTARALTLRDQLEALLPQLEALVSPETFDPGASNQPIDLAGTDFAVHTYGPEICRQVLSASPGAMVRFHSWRFDTMAAQIRRGDVDLGLYGGFAPADLSAADLVTERFVCVLASDHPLAAQTALTLDDYHRFGHVVIDVAEGIQPDIDYRLRALGADRTPVVTVPYHVVVPPLLAGTDLIATVPDTLALSWTDHHPVRVVGAPAEIATMPYRMVWHPAFDDDGRHRWLRSVVRAAVNLSRGAASAP